MRQHSWVGFIPLLVSCTVAIADVPPGNAPERSPRDPTNTQTIVSQQRFIA